MQAIYQTLNFIVDNGKYVSGFYEYNGDIPNLPQRLNRSLQVIKPTSLFILNEKPIILFFDKSFAKEKVFKQCWNFSEAPIIIIENESDFDVYNGFDYILDNGEFLLSPLSKNNELNYISILSGQYFENSKKLFDNKDKKVDRKLLKNIKEARDELLSNLFGQEFYNKISKIKKDKKKKLSTSLSIEELKEFKLQTSIANSLMGRLIFIRYLIDRNVKFNFNNIFNSQDTEQKKDELKRILSSKEETYRLFEYLKSDDGFNGDWFPILNDDENKIYEKEIVKDEHLLILQKLLNDYDFKNKQGSLFDFYDFAIIPIEFISNVYESFIGEEYQKESGSYYTPTFLVDYVLKYTVDDYLANNSYNCKVLDPACGSGIFLVETFRKLVSKYEKDNGAIDQKHIIQLVKDNIYGIDYNPNALKISVFSIYLAMLDYQNPSDIEKFKFPYLLDSENNPDTPNFFQNDFFDTTAEYNDILKKENFNFIIGNPPYGRSTIEKKSFADLYIKEEEFEIGSQDIVQPFMVRVKDFSQEDTKVAFIVTSKILYNINEKSRKFRQYFFNQFKISHLLELSSVRKEIFENAITPVSILFYQYSSQETILNNVINYISIKPNPLFSKLKILFISKSDFKKVMQSKVIENDYLWKILIYGSYLDFNFIKRLKEISIYDISVEKNYPKGMGIQATKGTSDIAEHIGKKFIEVPIGKNSNKYMNSFYIASELPKWTIEKVHRRGKSELFKKYSVLIRRGVNPKTFRAKSAILYEEAVFKHTLTGVNVSTKKEAQNFIGLINSSLFTYFNLEVASSFGIEREQLHDEEKLQAPYIKDEKIVSIVSKIETLKKDYFERDGNNLFTYEKEEKDLVQELDNTVLQSFNLTKQEYALVDYANSIVIPWVTRRNDNIVFEQLEPEDKRIEKYVDVFIKYYTKIYKEINMYFQAEVLWDEYAIGIYFKVLSKKPNKQIVWKKEKNIQNFLRLSSRKTLENLFIQKDIKGFEPDGFYVIKPNEYKNWHEAIGYLDFYEFDKAILGAGRRGGNV